MVRAAGGIELAGLEALTGFTAGEVEQLTGRLWRNNYLRAACGARR